MSHLRTISLTSLAMIAFAGNGNWLSAIAILGGIALVILRMQQAAGE